MAAFFKDEPASQSATAAKPSAAKDAKDGRLPQAELRARLQQMRDRLAAAIAA